MDGIDVVPFDPGHAPHLIANLRDADRREVAAVLGEVSEASFCAMASRARDVSTLLLDGRPAMVWGITYRTLLSGEATPWMVATTAADTDRRLRRAILRHSRAAAAYLMRDATVAWNLVAADNLVAIRWLRWLGFTLHDHIPQTVRGVSFIPFTMEIR